MSYYVLSGHITYTLGDNTYVFDFDNPSYADDLDADGNLINDIEYNELFRLRSPNARIQLGWDLLSDKEREIYNSLKEIYFKKYSTIQLKEIAKKGEDKNRF